MVINIANILPNVFCFKHFFHYMPILPRNQYLNSYKKKKNSDLRVSNMMNTDSLPCE